MHPASTKQYITDMSVYSKLTIEERTYSVKDGGWTKSCKLPKRQLHEHEGEAKQNQHQDEGK